MAAAAAAAKDGGGGGHVAEGDPSSSFSAVTAGGGKQVRGIGYHLLKKAGWQEGRGLGAAEQGPLQPLQAEVKHDRCGIGAVKRTRQSTDGAVSQSSKKQPLEDPTSEKAQKALSKKARKKLREEELAREQAIARSLYREFMPDNV